MAVGTIVSAWQEGGRQHIAVRVQEAGGAVEYVGSVVVADLDGLTVAQARASLVAAVKAARDSQRNTPAVLPHSGTVTI